MKRRNNLIIILLSAAVLWTVIGFFLHRKAGIYLEGKDKALIQQIFGIKNSQYQIINVKNTLRYSEYGGNYTVILKVNQEQMEELQKEIEQMFGKPLSKEEKKEIPFMTENATGIEPSENDYVYDRMSGVMRTVYSFGSEIPKTCYSTIVCLEPVNGVCKVVLNYSE